MGEQRRTIKPFPSKLFYAVRADMASWNGTDSNARIERRIACLKDIMSSNFPSRRCADRSPPMADHIKTTSRVQILGESLMTVQNHRTSCVQGSMQSENKVFMHLCEGEI